jgi:hypothetical protein
MQTNIENLTFKHTLSTGREIELLIVRSAGKRPKAIANFDCADLKKAELDEYLPWRNTVVSSLISILTPQEVFATV